MLIYQWREYRDNDIVRCTIQWEEMEWDFQEVDGRYYILHDNPHFNWGSPWYTNNYAYSWRFSSEWDTLNDNVHLIGVIERDWISMRDEWPTDIMWAGPYAMVDEEEPVAEQTIFYGAIITAYGQPALNSGGVIYLLQGVNIDLMQYIGAQQVRVVGNMVANSTFNLPVDFV